MLSRMEKRFEANKVFEQKYNEFMQEFIELPHMAPCLESLKDNRCFFLPHHGVFKANSATPKIRVVFNGSAKSASGLAINDVLHAGQNLLPDLSDLLTKWRSYSIVFIAYVKHMFRCILVLPEDQLFQLILWRSDK